MTLKRTNPRTALFALYLLLLGLGFAVFIFSRKNAGQYPDQPLDPSPAALTDRLIGTTRQSLAVNSDNPRIHLRLADLYLQKVRETADTAYYQTIDELMEEAERLDPRDPDILATRALVAMGRHDFAKGLSLAQEALRENAENPNYRGLVGDAEMELGKYEAAAASFQEMARRRPNFSSWSRIATIRELYGDIPGAMQALESAIQAGTRYPENIAWAHVELGKLRLRRDLTAASRSFEQALFLYPEYPPAFEGLGLIAFAKGEHEKAIEFFDRAFSRLPIAQYAIHLGESYERTGDPLKAEQHYALARIAFEKAEANGVNTNMEVALFLADHDREPETAVAKAHAAHAARPSIRGADTLAWALYKAGDEGAAESYVQQALRLGEHDPLALFHAGMIALKLGQEDEARRRLEKVMALHPFFSLRYSAVARETLENLSPYPAGARTQP